MPITQKHTPDILNAQIKIMIEEGWYYTDIYDRYGSDIERKWERKFSQTIGMPCALFNTGMAAIDTAVQHAEVRFGDVVLVSNAIYMNTKSA